MSELEDKLNQILSSPDEMEKIMNLARSFSASSGESGENETSVSGDSGEFNFGGIDPKMLGMMSRLMGQYSDQSSDKSALLNAMKPYLKKSRHATIDRAIEMTKLTKIAKIAFSEFGGESSGV